MTYLFFLAFYTVFIFLYSGPVATYVTVPLETRTSVVVLSKSY